MSHSATRESQASQSNLALKVRETLMLPEAVIVESVNGVMASMPKHMSELLKRRLKGNDALKASIKRVTVDIGIILTLAKSFQLDSDFEPSVSMIHDLSFTAHDGQVGMFAKAMVECELKSMGEPESALDRLIPEDVLQRRLRQLLAFFDLQMSRSH